MLRSRQTIMTNEVPAPRGLGVPVCATRSRPTLRFTLRPRDAAAIL